MSVIEIRHETRFRYSQEIPTSYNEARLTPLSLPRQRVIHSRVDIAPVTWQSTYVDYWETTVTAFEILRPHRELLVTARSRVEVAAEPESPADLPSWGDLADPALTDRLAEYLVNSAATEPDEELADWARATVARSTPHEAAHAICTFLHETIGYVPGSTTVHTPAAHAWRERSGVCQDFAHLAIGALRGVGIPARYVSGYLHPRRENAIGEPVAGQSHAWVEWWAGDWFGFDPTNDSVAADHHVVVARAREYADVMPVKGVFTGADSELTTVVEVTRLA
jgi:transglutaminase-like putative cysteine protease